MCETAEFLVPVRPIRGSITLEHFRVDSEHVRGRSTIGQHQTLVVSPSVAEELDLRLGLLASASRDLGTAIETLHSRYTHG
jgi:hypothetical protein